MFFRDRRKKRFYVAIRTILVICFLLYLGGVREFSALLQSFEDALDGSAKTNQTSNQQPTNNGKQ